MYHILLEASCETQLNGSDVRHHNYHQENQEDQECPPSMGMFFMALIFKIRMIKNILIQFTCSQCHCPYQYCWKLGSTFLTPGQFRFVWPMIVLTLHPYQFYGTQACLDLCGPYNVFTLIYLALGKTKKSEFESE